MTTWVASRAAFRARMAARSAFSPSHELRFSEPALSTLSRRKSEPSQLRCAQALGGATAPLRRERSVCLQGTASGVSTSATASSASPPDTSSAGEEISSGDDSWQMKLLYDGDCPICMREVDFLQRRNESYKTLKFVDIADPQYDPKENGGVSFEEAMGHIHGISRSGEIFTGIEAFQKFYEAIGLGWVYAATKLKPVQVLADAAYAVWAKYRLPLSGRPSLEAILEERRRAKEGVKGCNEEEECVAEY